MKKSKFTESQIIKGLKEYESGRSSEDICREMGINYATFSMQFSLKQILTFLLSCVCTITIAQKVTLEQGNLDFLKGQQSITIEFDYSSMSVGKFTTAQKYVDYKVDKLNATKYHNGDEWLKLWQDGQNINYPSRFKKVFNQYAGKKGLLADTGEIKTRYILTVKTKSLEPGYDVGISSYPAIINVQYIFSDAADPAKVLAVLSVSHVPGEIKDGYSNSFKGRIAEAYGNAGWLIGAYLSRKVL